MASITAFPSKKGRRLSYSNLRIVCCGGLWQEIRDVQTALILDQDDAGTLPKTGSIGCVTEHHNNRFANAVGKVQRSHSFLRVIEVRYSSLAAEMNVLEAERHSLFEVTSKGAQCGGSPLSSREQEILGEIQNVTVELALQIENFYTHGKILLDHIPHAFRAFFGGSPSCRLESHRKFLSTYDRYIEAKGLIMPEGFRTLAASLLDRLVAYGTRWLSMRLILIGSWRSPAEFKP